MFDLDLLGPRKVSKKQRKREVLEENVRRGKAAEDSRRFQHEIAGREVERTGRGSDFRVRVRNPFTGEVGRWKHEEVKSSDTAPISKLQRKKKTRVVRVNSPFWL